MEPWQKAYRAIEDFVEALARGEAKAWDAFDKGYLNLIGSIAWNFTHQREDAEDLRQEILLRIFRKIHKYQPGGSFKAWVVQVATNCAINWVKRRPRPEESLDDVMEKGYVPPGSILPDPEKITLKREEQRVVRDCVSELPERYREVVELDLAELKDEEIALALGLNKNTVATRLSRAKPLLKECIERKAPDLAKEWKKV